MSLYGPIHSVASILPGLQRRENFGCGQSDRRAAGPFQHFAAPAGNTHLQSLQVGQGIDLLVEPAAHLYAGVPGGKRDQAESVIRFAIQFEPAAVIHPGIHFHGVHRERQRREKLHGRRLAFPVIRSAVTHVCGARRHGIENLEGRHQFAAGKHLDFEPAVRRGFDVLGKAFDTRTDAREFGRPGRDHFPRKTLAGVAVRTLRLIGRTTAECQRTGTSQHISTFHPDNPEKTSEG